MDLTVLFIESILGTLGNDINLLVLGFKLVILLFIIAFVRGRLGAGPIVTILVFLFAYIILFTEYFAIFGPAMFIYLFITFGFISLLFDLAIAKPWRRMDMSHMGMGGVSEPGGPEETSRSELERIHHLKMAKKMIRGRF